MPIEVIRGYYALQSMLLQIDKLRSAWCSQASDLKRQSRSVCLPRRSQAAGLLRKSVLARLTIIQMLPMEKLGLLLTEKPLFCPSQCLFSKPFSVPGSTAEVKFYYYLSAPASYNCIFEASVFTTYHLIPKERKNITKKLGLIQSPN